MGQVVSSLKLSRTNSHQDPQGRVFLSVRIPAPPAQWQWKPVYELHMDAGWRKVRIRTLENSGVSCKGTPDQTAQRESEDRDTVAPHRRKSANLGPTIAGSIARAPQKKKPRNEIHPQLPARETRNSPTRRMGSAARTYRSASLRTSPGTRIPCERKPTTILAPLHRHPGSTSF